MTTVPIVMANRDPLSEQSPERSDRVFLPAPSGPVRALLACSAEQDWRNIDSLLSRVTHTQYRLERAAGYGAAVRAIAEESHDVLVVDDRLDNGTAINLLREAAENRCAMPVILITGEENAEIEGWAIEAGAIDCLARRDLSPALFDRAIRLALTRKNAADRIRRLAEFDQLTGLANRTSFRAMLNRAIAQARGGDRMLALMLVGLDRFTLVNETMGHAAGDTLLRSVTDRLCNCIRAAADRHTDMLARVGNDEFALVLEGIESLDEAAAIAERISGSMAPPFDINGHEIFVTTSIGISTYPLCGWNADTLINSANTAVHRAKERGRNSYQFYTRTMTARELQRLVLQTSLHRALERREFQLYYQPQIGLGDGALIGAEALLRWRHPEFGLLGPDQFIPLAEETGLIIPLGNWVLDSACAQAKIWRDAGLPDLRVAVNLSPRQFREPSLAASITDALEGAGLTPDHLALELTESILMEDTDMSNSALSRFRDMGLHVSIDDFGTGYSSLSYLKRFPLDALKIDKSFVQDITTDTDDAHIATAIIGLAHNLNLGVIAEGVEASAQLDFLRDRNCDAVQGFLYGHPVPAEEFEAMLQNRRTSTGAGDGPAAPVITLVSQLD